jgi:hypothetical protein
MFLIKLLLMIVALENLQRSAGRTVHKISENDFIVDTSDIEDNQCEELPSFVLTDILGPAFNSRYMSIEPPAIETDNYDDASNAGKRDTSAFPPFYVDDNYALEISDKPAWEVRHVQGDPTAIVERQRREAPKNKTRDARAIFGRKSGTKAQPTKSPRPWECESIIRWVDLGPDYFPRFLRTVECTKHNCWYGHYTCQPRSFTVKILRRRNGQCVQSDQLRKIGLDGLPGDLRELWVWEERAVNFCCDCAAPKH